MHRIGWHGNVDFSANRTSFGFLITQRSVRAKYILIDFREEQTKNKYVPMGLLMSGQIAGSTVGFATFSTFVIVMFHIFSVCIFAVRYQ